METFAHLFHSREIDDQWVEVARCRSWRVLFAYLVDKLLCRLGTMGILSAPGGYSVKTNEMVVEVDAYEYYAIHLDVIELDEMPI